MSSMPYNYTSPKVWPSILHLLLIYGMLITHKLLASSQQFLAQLLYLLCYCSIRYRFITRAIDIDSADNEATKFADLYFFGPRG
jgi:hypothetical protein